MMSVFCCCVSYNHILVIIKKILIPVQKMTLQPTKSERLESNRKKLQKNEGQVLAVIHHT